MDISKLKGEKKNQAILSLASDAENTDLLYSLVQSEKGNSKQAAMQALATFDYEPAYPIWKKLLKSKNKGEKIFMESTTDSVSDIVADEFMIFLTGLIQQKDGYKLSEAESSEFKTFISLMLGKASDKMQELYQFIAQNTDKLSTFKLNSGSKDLLINDYLHFYNPDSNDIKKIFPAILSMSIVKTLDNRLIKLANELNDKHHENWLSPAFISKLLTHPASDVYEQFSDYLSGSVNTSYIYDTLGTLYFDKKINQHVALLFWGQYKYGEIDTRIAFSRPLFENLDEKWYLLLINNSQPKVTLQIYNRSGVSYEAFDELFVEILPAGINNKVIQTKLNDYFSQREKLHNGFSTLYIEAFNTLGCDINEDSIRKYIDCKDNAVSKYSLKVTINQYTNWSAQRKLAFYKTLPAKLILSEEIEQLSK